MQLNIRNVSKTYPIGVQALKGVTLTIPAGGTACSARMVPAECVRFLNLLSELGREHRGEIETVEIP
jgi:hypothetical protein